MKYPLLQFFAYEHLPAHLQSVSKPFHDLAWAMAEGDNDSKSGNVTFGSPLPQNAETTVALRKLLESKDCAIRSVLSV